MAEGQKKPQNSAELRPVKQNISDGYFCFALCFVAALVIPYLYYAYTVYEYN